MRDIRFRQWDSFQKKMIYNIGVSDFGWGGFPFVSWDKYPIMQFTGLCDMHEKEIYEGDILTWDDFKSSKKTSTLGYKLG